MAVPGVLLLSGTTPGENLGGALVLRDLCRLYPHDRIVSFSYASSVAVPSPDLDWLPMGLTERTLPRRFRRVPQGVRAGLRLLSFEYQRYTWGRRLQREAVAFGRAHGVGCVLSVLDDPMIICVARHVAHKLGVPLFGLVWDSPEWFYRQVGVLPLRRLLRDFKLTMQSTARCAVVSKEMQDLFRSRYDVETVVICHGIQDAKRYPGATSLLAEDQLVIGFGGGLYAWQEWYALLGALEDVGWRIGSRAVKIRYLGRQPLLPPGFVPSNVEFLGFRPWEEVTRLLAQTDILYLPLPPHNPTWPLARWSFPSKMVTYLAVGRPIFYHGPADGTPVRILKEYSAGLCCHTLDHQDILAVLQGFVEDTETYRQMAAGSQAAMDQEFSWQVFRRQFARLLGISEDDLL
jgi:glycosyltransferase involved in cell wall biosynthesis